MKNLKITVLAICVPSFIGISGCEAERTNTEEHNAIFQQVFDVPLDL